MERERVWKAIDEQRRSLVDLLEDLSEQEWRQPSLCAGWTVRDVAAHVALQNVTWSALPKLLVNVARSGGMNRAIADAARDHAALPVETIIAEIRDRIGVWKPLPTVSHLETAIDYVVHTQDIAVPLGRQVDPPADAVLAAAERVWASPRMFHARRKLAGRRLVATDAQWSAGEGEEISGPMVALLLVMTGRSPRKLEL
ncbi:MAG: maleylpyruvate isomerase family mycothiol-dependent enzyme [Nonomuraea sp.]|nr:maleylpyruvate isomerase family mycothiol-dependent enzyme [Nonomuraea sp.]